MTTFTPEQKLTLIKHLADGKPADIVATIMNTKAADVIEVARHHGYPDLDKLRWAADILAKNIEKDSAAAMERPLATGGQVLRGEQGPELLIPVRPGATIPHSDGTKALIATAKAHPSKRIQAAADKAIDALAKVRDLLAEDEEKNAEKRRLESEKAAAKAEVERLEKQLRDAKARLRGGTSTPAPKAKKASNTAPKGDHPCRHTGCDRVFDTGQGRSLHERLRCEHRPASVA